MRWLLFVLALMPMSASAQGYQGDPAIGAALAGAFGTSTEVIDNYLFPNNPDPAQATEALAVLYTVIEGAAGNFNIDVGYLARQGDAYGLVARVDGVYGTEPRDVQFLADRILVTTTMPRETDPRCCPTGTTDWTIIRSDLSVLRADR